MRSTIAKESCGIAHFQSGEKMSRRITLSCFCLLLWLSAIAHAGQSVPALTADFTVNISPNGGQSRQIDGRYARSSDGKTREETAISVIIVDPKMHTTSILNPFTKEAKVIELKAPPNQKTHRRPDVSLDVFEEAFVDGHPVVKRRGVRTSDGATREIWIASDISIPVLVKTSDASKTSTKTFRNISLGEPDPTLFSIPADYKIISNPGNGACILSDCNSVPVNGLAPLPR